MLKIRLKIQAEKLAPAGKDGSYWLVHNGQKCQYGNISKKNYCTKTVEPSASNLPSIIHMPGALWPRVDKTVFTVTSVLRTGLKNG